MLRAPHPAPRAWFHLADAEELAASSPTTFVILPREERDSLGIADVVKICLVDNATQQGERVWVMIERVVRASTGEVTYTGYIDNPICAISGLQHYDTVSFSPNHIFSKGKVLAPNTPEAVRQQMLETTDECLKARLASLAPTTPLEHMRIMPALMVPTLRDDVARVEEVLALGIPVDIALPNGNTPLYCAAYKGLSKMVTFLLGKGANAAVFASNGIATSPTFSPLQAAAMNGHSAVVEALITKGGVPPDHPAKSGKGKKASTGREMVLDDADASATEERCSIPPLRLGVSFDRLDVVKTLIRFGADVFCLSEEGNSTLCEAESPEMVDVLFAAGVPVNTVDKVKRTALMYHSHYGNLSVVNALIKHNAALDLSDEGGQTALHHSVITGQVQCALALIRAGARTNVKDKDGETPLDIARNVPQLLQLVEEMEGVAAKKGRLA